MLDKLKAFWGRVQIRWHVVSLAILAALPELLNWLGVIDLKPILAHLGLSDNVVSLIVAIMPFMLTFVKSAIAVDPKETTAP